MVPLFPPLPQSQNTQVSNKFHTEGLIQRAWFCWVMTFEILCLVGPKLYKEPSFKSNKFIIHNAITRCCLAGKVNEPQKNKIVEVSHAAVSNKEVHTN